MTKVGGNFWSCSHIHCFIYSGENFGMGYVLEACTIIDSQDIS